MSMHAVAIRSYPAIMSTAEGIYCIVSFFILSFFSLLNIIFRKLGPSSHHVIIVHV